MPFTANRQFKKAPRLLARAEGMYYWTPEGRQVLDGTSGLWCVNAGHCRPKIVEAVQRQVARDGLRADLPDGPPGRVRVRRAPGARRAAQGFSRVFFTNSGSESADTALKIALAYHRARGEAGRFRLIGRERGYHGVNFGGMAVGGITANKKVFGPGVAGVDHIRHTHDPARNAFSRGQPKHGAEFADELERLCVLHDPSTIAAVIVEPVAGSAGVLVPPRGLPRAPARDLHAARHPAHLRRGDHRLRPPRQAVRLAALRRDAGPLHHRQGHDERDGADGRGVRQGRRSSTRSCRVREGIELFHGYTYSGHPLACAAGIATLDTYEEEGLLTRAAEPREALGGRRCTRSRARRTSSTSATAA